MINVSDFPIIKKLIEKFGGKVNEGQLNSAIDAKVADGTIASGEQLDNNVQQMMLNARYNKSSKTQYWDKPMVTFITDDGNLKDYTIFWKKIFEPLGVPFTTCMITSNIGKDGWLSLDNLKELHEKGNTIASHSHTHLRADTTNFDALYSDYKMSRDILCNLGFDGNLFVVPFSVNTADSRKAERMVFDNAVCTNNKFENGASDINGTGITSMNGIFDNYHIARRNCLGEVGITLANCKADVDYAIANKLWLVFMSHSHYSSYFDMQENIDEFKELVSYIKTKCEIVNLREGFLRRGNVLDVGDRNVDNNWLVVRPNGKTYGNQLGLEFSNYNINNSTTITFFEKGKTVKTCFTNTTIQGKGFPINVAGILETTVSTDGNVGFQKIQDYGNNLYFKRYWIGSKNSWSNWEKFSSISISEEIFSKATGNINKNKWYKIIDLVIKDINADYYNKLNYSFCDNAIGNKFSVGDIIISIKSSNPLSGNPKVSLGIKKEVIDTTYSFDETDIIAVSNYDSVTNLNTVSIYCRIRADWRQMRFLSLNKSIQYPFALEETIYSKAEFTSDIEPVGNKTVCTVW